MTIFGTLHLQEHSGGHFLQPAKNQRDIARFDFADNDPLEVISMLESVLSTVRQRVEAVEADKKAKIEAAKDKGIEKPKPVMRGRRAHLEDDPELILGARNEEELDDEDEEDETPTGKPRSQQEADEMQREA